jgi:hypothetical protein
MACRAISGMVSKPAHAPWRDRSSALELYARSSHMDQQREQERMRIHANASAHSASLASTQTPDSVMSMHGNSDAFPVHVLEPTPQEWPLDGGQHSSRQQTFAAGRRSMGDFHPGHYSQNAQLW